MKALSSKWWKRLTGLALCIAILGTAVPLPEVNAAEEETRYVSEVRLSEFSSESKAKKWLTSHGYTVVDSDLNKGAGSDYIYLGYKTTTNKDEAITDIRVMNMNGGYDMEDYRDILTEISPELRESARKLMAAAAEFKARYSEGSPNAVLAKYVLDQFYTYLEKTKVSLGDWIMNPARTVQDFCDVISMCNTDILQTIYSQLALGVSDYRKDSWLERLAATDMEQFGTGNLTLEMDALYYDKAVDLMGAVQTLAESYSDAVSTVRTVGVEEGSIEEAISGEEDAASAEYEETETEIESEEYATTAEETETEAAAESESETAGEDAETEEETVTDEETEDETVTEAETETETETESTLPADDAEEEGLEEGTMVIEESEQYIVAIVEGMNEYQIGGTPIGDWLVEIGSMEDPDPGALYPLVAAFTEGQAAMAEFVGLAAMYGDVNNTRESYEYTRSMLEPYLDDMKAASGEDQVSIWYGVNRELLEGEVAVTSAARVRIGAGAELQELIRTDGDTDSEMLNQTLQIVGMASGIISGIYGIVFGALSIYLKISVNAVVSLAWSCSWGVSASSVLLGAFGFALSALGIVGIIATAIILIIMLVKWIQSKKIKYDPIPNVMFDHVTDTNSYVKYTPVLNDQGEEGDVNGFQGKTWNAIYTTKDPDAGSPIVAPADGSTFLVKTGNGLEVDGYESLKHFGYVVAANLNRGAKKDNVGGIYMFYRTEDSLNGNTEEEPEEPVPSGTYLTDVQVSLGSSEEAAMDALIAKGYTPVNVNLMDNSSSGNNKGKYAFLGYKYTTDVNQALVRDIRIAYNLAENVSYGDVSYGKAGDSFGAYSLYYTNNPAAGDPILADSLEVADSVLPQESGKLPIAMFGSGAPFNFCSVTTEDIYEWYSVGTVESGGYVQMNMDIWEHTRFIYYTPLETYTSGTRYISGIAVMAGSVEATLSTTTAWNFMSDEVSYECVLEDWAEDLGLEVLKADGNTYDLYEELTDDIFKPGGDNQAAYFVYSWTYNPYRAITDIKFFNSKDVDTTGLAAFLSDTGVYYSAADVFYQKWEKDLGGLYSFRRLRTSRSYLARSEDEGAPRDEDWYASSMTSADGKKKSKFYPYLMNLYVAGPSASGTPITVDGLVLSRSEAIPEGYRPVTDFVNKYEAIAVNLMPFGQAYDEKGNLDSPHVIRAKELYMYIRGDQPTAAEQGRYIAGLSISASETEDYASDEAIIGAISATVPPKDNTTQNTVDYRKMGEIIDFNFSLIQANVKTDVDRIDTKKAKAALNLDWKQKYGFYISNNIGEEGLGEYNIAGVVRVIRSSARTDAITDVKLVLQKKKQASDELTINGYVYKKAGEGIRVMRTFSSIVLGMDMYLFFYTTTNVAAGDPITEITVEPTTGDYTENGQTIATIEDIKDYGLEKKKNQFDTAENREGVLGYNLVLSRYMGSLKFVYRLDLFTDEQSARYAGYPSIYEFSTEYNGDSRSFRAGGVAGYRMVMKLRESSAIKGIIAYYTNDLSKAPEVFNFNGIVYKRSEGYLKQRIYDGPLVKKTWLGINMPSVPISSLYVVLYTSTNNAAGEAMTPEDMENKIDELLMKVLDSFGQGASSGLVSSVFNWDGYGMVQAALVVGIPALLLMAVLLIPQSSIGNMGRKRKRKGAAKA